MSNPLTSTITAARDALGKADALLIHAGAGIGVDSGLPDFRGNEGFWNAYPPYRTLGLDFMSLANPRLFKADPTLAWGFYGHRLQIYRDTVPHAGFDLMRDFAARLPHGAFVFTSNVDGQFQKAGFDAERIVECHGSIHHLQCARPCCDQISINNTVAPAIDHATMRAAEPLPRCPDCGALSRPNILMFGDGEWLADHSQLQQQRFNHWLRSIAGKRVTIIEFGAGTGIPTVRYTSERLMRQLGATLIRVNPREPEGPHGTLSLPLGALAASSHLFSTVT